MSRRIFTMILAAGALLAGSLQAQNGPKPLSNDDVVTLIKGGLSESTVIEAIQSQDTNFDISANGLLQLKKGGVTSKVMEAMFAAAKKKTGKGAEAAAEASAGKPNSFAGIPSVPGTSLSGPAASPGQLSVLIAQGSSKQLLPISHTQVIEAKTKASTLGALASDGTLKQAMAGVKIGRAHV